MDRGFRVWCHNKKEYETHDVLMRQDGTLCELNMGLRPLRSDTHTMEWSTGIESVDGKPIYDGDVLTADEYPFKDGGKRNYDAHVSWFEEEAAFGITLVCVNPDKGGISHGISELFGERDCKFEIVGTVHDHSSKRVTTPLQPEK